MSSQGDASEVTKDLMSRWHHSTPEAYHREHSLATKVRVTGGLGSMETEVIRRGLWSLTWVIVSTAGGDPSSSALLCIDVGVGAASGGPTLSQEITQATLDSRARQRGQAAAGRHRAQRPQSHGLSLCALPSSLRPSSGQAGCPAAEEQEPFQLVGGGCGLVPEGRRPSGPGAPCGALPEACMQGGGAWRVPGAVGWGASALHPEGAPRGRPEGTTGFSEQNSHLVLLWRHVCPICSLTWPLSGVLFSRPSICLCIQQTLVTHPQRASKLTVPILKLLWGLNEKMHIKRIAQCLA